MTTVRSRPKVLSLTEAAVGRIKTMMASKGEDVVGLRIGVKKGGCAGMEYAMSWATALDKFDEVVEQDGARVVVEPTAVLYLLGTEMDYQTSKMSSGVVFNTSNQKSACRCGVSVELVPAASDKLDALKS